ncbi:MAG: DUF6286 domain-containing protein [Kocuria sp.]|nr:DUF6286 domain-containing protein [Kocuria sp.]
MSTGTFPALRRRPARVLPSMLVALLGIALVAVVATAAIQRMTQGQWPQWVSDSASTVSNTPSTDPLTLTTGIVIAVIGLVILACALLPGAFNRAQLRVDDSLYSGEQDTVLTNRGLVHIVEASVNRVDGVRSVRADVSTRKVRLNVETPLRDSDRIRSEAAETAHATLRKLPLVKQPAVAVSIQHKKG